MKDRTAVAYLIARLLLGMSMLGHGVARLPRLSEFSGWMQDAFAKTWLPEAVVAVFGLTLPVVELLVGIALLLGVLQRTALLTGSAIMLALIFGSCLIEEWQNVFVQLFYGLYFALLYLFQDEDRIALQPRY